MQRGFSQQLIDHTKRVWQPYADSPLTDQDAVDILLNVLDLVAYLNRLGADA